MLRHSDYVLRIFSAEISLCFCLIVAVRMFNTIWTTRLANEGKNTLYAE